MEERRRPDQKLNDIERDLAGFTAKVTEWMSSTTEYRKSLCSKIDELNRKMNELPCKERKGLSDSINKQLGLLWAVTGGVLIKIVADWVNK